MIVSQTEFTAGLIDPARAVPAGVHDAQGRPASKRFDVYRNNVAVSLTEALISAFPVIYKLVGDEFFRAMAGVYLRTHLPTSPRMMFYGNKLPEFLMRFPPAQSLAYLPDVARLEIAMRESYHAADAQSVTAETLQSSAPIALMAARFSLSPALKLVRSSHPIYGIWQFNMVQGAPLPQRQAENVVITRRQFDPTLHLVTDDEADFLAALQMGRPIGVALSQVSPGFPLGDVLQLLLRENALAAID